MSGVRNRIRVPGPRLAPDLPALLGGRRLSAAPIPVSRPALPTLDRVFQRLQGSYEHGVLTDGPNVRRLEELVADRLGVRHAVAVNSCTTGLLLVVAALRPQGGVVVPSFTFSATAHALAWNRASPVFAECDPATFQLDPVDAASRLAGSRAILATHVFGAPCPVEQIETLGAAAGVPVVFDAAHAFGGSRGGRPIGGFGMAEVFSLSPTKPLVAGEGGLVTTNHDAVAEFVRIGRNYGNPGDYDCRFVGLNGRMSELHAALAIESLHALDHNLERRRRIADRYRSALLAIPGLTAQRLDPGDRSTYKDFTITVDADEFGLTRNEVARALKAEAIDTRPYFDPPAHRQQAYASAAVDLPITDALAPRVLSLPMYPGLSGGDVDVVVESLARLHRHAELVHDVLSIPEPAI